MLYFFEHGTVSTMTKVDAEDILPQLIAEGEVFMAKAMIPKGSTIKSATREDLKVSGNGNSFSCTLCTDENRDIRGYFVHVALDSKFVKKPYGIFTKLGRYLPQKIDLSEGEEI